MQLVAHRLTSFPTSSCRSGVQHEGVMAPRLLVERTESAHEQVWAAREASGLNKRAECVGLSDGCGVAVGGFAFEPTSLSATPF